MARSKSRSKPARPKRDKAGAATSPPESPRGLDRHRMLTLAIWLVVTVGMLALFANTLDHQTTWYLAVDQFGYLLFANDLLSGTVFHDWAPATAMEPILPKRTDMLAQTYIFENGHLYSRYAPGFPILLASWIVLLGRDAAHFLNPTLFITLLGIVIAMQWALTRSLWRGTAVAALIFIFPTHIHLWGLTLTRDMSAHVVAFSALTLLLTNHRPLTRRRILVAGVLLGFAGSIRPDAVMYLIPAAIIATWRWATSAGGRDALGALVRWGAAGVLIGLFPLLAFNGVTTGNPLFPAQGVELKRLFSGLTPSVVRTAVAAPAAVAEAAAPAAPRAAKRRRSSIPKGSGLGWHGGSVSQVQGGGLRLAHFRHTFWGNWTKIRYGYSRVLLGVAVVGIGVGLLLRPMFTVAALAYIVVAVLFFSCWTRPDSRYLIGVWVLIPMLIAEGLMGTFDFIRWLWRRNRHAMARAVAIGAGALLVGGYLTFGEDPSAWRRGSSMPLLLRVLVSTGGVAAVVAAIWTHRRIGALIAGAFMFAAVGVAVAHALPRLEARASFQRPQAERARVTFRRAVDPKGVVITTESIGRPMENIEHYANRRALYLTDLRRWHTPIPKVARTLVLAGHTPYLLLERREVAELLPDLREAGLSPELVVEIPPQRNYDYFVAAPFHRGLDMQLWRIRFPAGEQLLRDIEAYKRAHPEHR